MENARNIKRYEDYLKNEEKADATIRKYLHEVEQLLAYMDKAEISKADLTVPALSQQPVQSGDCQW